MAGWDIGQVLDRVDLGALLDELTVASGSGRYRRWHCPAPDHDDHRPSVTMHTDRTGHERWRCWSGDPSHRGDAVDLVTVATGRAHADALDWLAGRAHMMPNAPLPPVRPKPPPPPRPTVLDPVVAQYAHTCASILWTRTGGPVREWLHHRGLDDTTLRAHQVGADPGRSMLPRREGLPRGAMTAAVFPAFDPAGHTITYVQARYLEPERAGVKYDNPSGALGPNPRLAWCHPEQPGGDVLVVVEGIPDALVAARAGFRAVGLLGAQTPDQRVAAALSAVARNEQRRVVIIPDRDDAGRYAAARLGELLAGFDVTTDVLEPGHGADLTDWARTDRSWSRHLQPTGPHPSHHGEDRAPSRTR